MSSALEQAQDRLASYLAAEKRILDSQEYAVGHGGTARRNRRADLQQVQAGIVAVRAEIERLKPIGSRARRVTYLRPY